MAEERIDVILELHDALSRPAGHAEAAVEDLGDEVEQLAAKEALATAETKRLDRALNALDRAMGRYDKTTNKAAGSTKENARQTRELSKAQKALDANAKAAATKGMALLGKAFKILKLPVILSLVMTLAGAVSSLGAAGFAAVAQLAPLVGVLGAMPALLGAILGGFAAVKLGFSGIGKALKVMTDPSASIEKQAEAMDKLTPAAQRFVRVLVGAKAQTDKWSAAVQGALFPGLEDGLRSVLRLSPRVEAGLAGNAEAMGDLARQTGSFVGGSGRDVTKIFNSNERIIRRGLTPALVAFVGIFLDFMVAGAPLAQRFADWIGVSATNVADLVNEGRRTGKLQDFLMRAGDLAADVGGFLGNVAVALYNIGKQSDALGMGGLGQLAKDWADWTGSVEGSTAIRDWFADAAPLMSELGRTVKILSKGFLDLAGNGSITAIFKQINDELLPSVMDLSQTASSALIPALLDGLDAFIRFQTGLGQSPLPELLQGIATVLGLIVDGFDALPGPIRFAVAAMLAAKTAGTLLNVPLKALVAQGPKLKSTFGDVRAGMQLYSEGLSGIPRATGMARGAIEGLKGAGKGLLGVFGGPWGLAISAAVAGLGYFISKQKTAKAHVDDLKASLDAESGALTQQSRASIAAALESEGLIKDAQDAGLALSDVAGAAEGNTDALGRLGDAYVDIALHSENLDETEKNLIRRLQDEGKTGIQIFDQIKAHSKTRADSMLTDAYKVIGGVRDETNAVGEARGSWERTNAVLEAGKPKVDAYRHGVSMSADAAERAAGATDRQREAIIKLNDTLVGQQRTWIGFRQNVSDAKKTLTEGKLTLNTYTQAGRDNKSALLDVAEAASQVENKAARTHAIKEAKDFISRWAEAAGMGKKKADQYADSLFKLTGRAKEVPPKVPMDVEVKGIDTVLGRMADVKAYADLLDGRVIHMETRLDRAGFARKDGGAVWQYQDFKVGEVGPELFIGASGRQTIIGAAGPTTMKFPEPGVVVPNAEMPHWVTDGLERPVPASVTAPSGEAGMGSVPDVHLHFHGDSVPSTPAELEAMIIAAWRRYDRERKERS